MDNPLLARSLLSAFRQALDERRFEIAELLLQAIEHLDLGTQRSGVLEDAYLMLATRGARTRAPAALGRQ